MCILPIFTGYFLFSFIGLLGAMKIRKGDFIQYWSWEEPRPTIRADCTKQENIRFVNPTERCFLLYYSSRRKVFFSLSDGPVNEKPLHFNSQLPSMDNSSKLSLFFVRKKKNHLFCFPHLPKVVP